MITALLIVAAILLLACLIGMGFGQRLAELARSSTFDPQDRERLGILEADRAKRREQVERAVARHKIQQAEKNRRAA